MKKKIEALMFDGRLIGNTAFEQLQKEYQAARNQLEKSKAAKIQAKSAYQAVESGEIKHSEENKMALRTAFRKAKYMHLAYRADYDLIDYRLSQWLKTWESDLAAASAGEQAKTKKTTRKTPTPPPAPAHLSKQRTAKAKLKTETPQ